MSPDAEDALPSADKRFARERRVNVLSRPDSVCQTEEKRGDQGDAQHDLTRIRLHPAIYFCLHRGKHPRKDCTVAIVNVC